MALNDITVLQEQADGSLKEVLVTSVGQDLLSEARNGTSNTHLGATALASPSLSGGGNSALGDFALRFNTTGVNNSAVGLNALRDNVGGSNNSAFGISALSQNETGGGNAAFGGGALRQNNGSNNSAVGADALNKNIAGSSNSAFGVGALLNNNASGNVAFGVDALVSNVSGVSNAAVGNNALQGNTSNFNVAVGSGAGASVNTGSSNTIVGTGADVDSGARTNCTVLGRSASVTADNQVQLGDAATTTYAYGAVQDRSDVRDKADVRDTVLGLEFINALRPVDFKWDMREDYRPTPPTFPAPDASEEELAAYAEAKAAWSESAKLANLEHDGTHKRTRYHHGLIAQEVKAVLEDSNVDFGGFQDHTINGGDNVLSIGYIELIAPLIRAVQELKAEVETLKANAEQ